MIGTVGEPCLIKEEPDFAIKNIGLFKTRGEMEAKWLFYYLRSPEAQQSMREQSRGTTQQYIPLGALREFPILAPNSRQEMRVATHILGTLDDKIELNRRMNETLEAMAQALFKSWFVDFDPVRVLSKQMPEKPPLLCAKALKKAGFPARLQDSELGEIPENWRPGTLGEVAEHPRRVVVPDKLKPSTPYIGFGAHAAPFCSACRMGLRR
jgi:type I restriction enzyme S subunit